MMTAQHDPISQLDRASELIDQVEQRTGGVASKKQLISVQRRTSRLLYAAVAICLLISLATAVVVAIMIPRLVRTETGLAVNSAAIQSAIDTREELRRSGVAEQDLPPIPETQPTDQGVDIGAIVDTITAQVLAEIRNDPRYRGPNGLPGEPCDPVINPACKGVPGDPGDNGSDGAKGDKGDPCLPETEGCRGPAGNDAPRITDAGPTRNDSGVCVFRTTLEDGTIFDKPTREENCPVIPESLDPAFPDEGP